MSYWVTLGTVWEGEDRPGCYVFIHQGKAIYVGQTKNIALRLQYGHRITYGYSRSMFTPWGQLPDAVIKVKYTRRAGDWLMIEHRLIQRLRPKFNLYGVRRNGKASSVPVLR